MNKKYITFGFLFCLSFVVALQITNFTGYSTSENMTFTESENITRNITFYKNANITDAVMNLDGEPFPNSNVIDNATSFLCDAIIDNCNNSNDNDFGTFASQDESTTTDYVYENYTVNSSGAILSIKANGRGQVGSVESEVFAWNYTLGDYSLIGTTDGNISNIENFTISYEFISSNNLRLKIGVEGTSPLWVCGGTCTTGKYYESRIYEADYPTNASITINNTEVWSYAGSLTSNNQTEDFSSTLNTALNGGTCDCNGCTLEGDNCTMNFTFHSATACILKYSNIDINWLEYTSPNSTITEPTGEYTTTEIPYNVSTSDNWETDFCTYWVTRGASLEVANTSVTCSNEITGNTYVSSENTNYVFHFWVNDTSGNTNYSSSSFSTSSDATVIVQGGGGGGSTIITEKGADWTMEAGGGVGTFDINLIKGTSQVREVLFFNIGDESRTLSLSCEDQEGTLGCKFVTFESDTIILPLIQDIPTSAEFTMTVPKEEESGDYIFNILAIDDKGREARISVFLSVKEIGFLSKVTARTEGGFPYILVAIISFMVSMVVSLAILTKSKSKIKPLIAVIISATATYLIVLIF